MTKDRKKFFNVKTTWQQLGNNSEKTEIFKIDFKLTKASELCK